jgi:hypothetical protein
VNLALDEEHATELREVLDEVLGDMSSEIASTDNALYRSTLQTRRDRLRAIRAQLST